MIRQILLVMALMSSALISGCAISPRPIAVHPRFCHAPHALLDVEVRNPQAVALAGRPREDTLAAQVLQLYDTARREGPLAAGHEPVSDSMILLSGGSQDGAFGAGFLHGWHERGGNGIPRARIVTGISTGAIISTFAFLREPAIPYAAYRADREDQILHAYPGARGGRLTSAITALRRGALADLSPLREGLLRDVTRGRMLLLARQFDDRRRLYVGAVDMDLGRMVAFDMTALADRYRRLDVPDADESPEQLRIRKCYADIIVASSSVPLAAPPAFIDNRMYIDGGARFGVFTYEFEQVIRGLTAAGLAPRRSRGGYPYLYVIVNGDLTVDPVCRTSHARDCIPAQEPQNVGAHRSWSLPELAERSAAVLIDQGYRFSVARLHDIGRLYGYTVRVEHILPDLRDFPFTMPPDKAHLGSGERTCGAWRTADEEIDNPVEFHPRFMNCLVAYGRRRALNSGWRSHVQRP